MGFTWVTWHYLTDEQYKEAIERRRTSGASSTGGTF
jgi:hypothetical protein